MTSIANYMRLGIELDIPLLLLLLAGITAMRLDPVHSRARVFSEPANYMRLGIELDIPLLLLLLAGTIAGASTGPRLSRYLHERWLQGILCLVLLLIGLRYLGVF